MGPPRYVCWFTIHYNPHEYYSYIYHKATEIRQLNANLGGPILQVWFLFHHFLLTMIQQSTENCLITASDGAKVLKLHASSLSPHLEMSKSAKLY